ncbi:MAG: hypothetical protein PHT44_03040 [Candidatus Portnoybacteria bacterium]|nr:hypothetical protein [Candidatus Portnoybacteria bacterium]MDD4982518.1 hypothetical protein [Candidatus Portnoybacteria bacterium]
MKSREFSRRALNLSLAIYRITDGFPQREVLSGQLRELGNRIAGDLAQGIFIPIEKNIDRLKIYFEIAKAQNWVKPINWTILDFEYHKLQQEVVFRLKAGERGAAGEPGKRNNIVSHNIKAPERRSSQKPAASAQVNSSGRRSKILAALDKNAPLKISDLSPLFKNDISERTLRNELAGMARAGLIKKSGEKKATEYSVK